MPNELLNNVLDRQMPKWGGSYHYILSRMKVYPMGNCLAIQPQ